MLGRLAAILTGLSFLVLAGTGFYGWIGAPPLHGWSLWAHSVGAPFFIVGLTVLTLSRAERFRFGAASNPSVGTRVVFWTFLSFGAISIASIQWAMLPTSSQQDQSWFLGWHRFAAVGLSSAALALVLLVIGARFRGRGDPS